MTAVIVDLAAQRAARGIAPVLPEEAFGPPVGKRVGDRVRVPSGFLGTVWGWRPSPGRAPILFVAVGFMSFAIAADRVDPA